MYLLGNNCNVVVLKIFKNKLWSKLHSCLHFFINVFIEKIINFSEKYEFVGRLLRPGEEPTNYSDEEDESNAVEAKPKEEADAGGDKPKAE